MIFLVANSAESEHFTGMSQCMENVGLMEPAFLEQSCC